MKHYNEWNKKMKIAFCCKCFTFLIILAGLLGIISTGILDEMSPSSVYFIFCMIFFPLMLLISIYDLLKWFHRANGYFNKMDQLQSANQNPEFVKNSRILREAIEDLDIQTLGTIKDLVAKKSISKVVAAKTIVKTELVVESLNKFMIKYPSLKVIGVKDPKILKELYRKRVEALNKYI